MKLSNKIYRVMVFVVSLTIEVTCWSFQKSTGASSIFRLHRNRGKFNLLFPLHEKGDINNSEEDWRDVRAKLVMQYCQEEDICKKRSDPTSASRTKSILSKSKRQWTYDSKGAIEVGSLIVSHPSQDSACGGLRQQHFHKCIVFIINHSPKGTQGIILNRPTNRRIFDIHQNEWKCHFGGNTRGIGLEDESLGCLYRLEDYPRVRNGMALPILVDIGIVSWDKAQILIRKKEAVLETFRLYSGYTNWRPGQLEKELKRGDWFTVATDVRSLWDIIAKDPNFSTGTDKWVQIMNRIGKGSLISSVPDQKFQDDMLKQYIRLRLLDKPNNDLRRSMNHEHQTQRQKDRVHNLSPGTLVRSSTPILLNEQVFHQSLVLILKNDENMTVGVVLNRPHSTAIIVAGENLPMRYGGRYELDDGDMSELWLHCNHQTLQKARVGEPISKKDEPSIFWKCSRKEAENAVEVGVADANDFLVISGSSVWTKDPFSYDRESLSSVELDKYFSKVDENSIDTIWKLLKVQEPLNENNAADNLEVANAAWMFAGDAGWMRSGASKQLDYRSASDMDMKEQQNVQSLAHSALDKWIRMYLLTP
mmetsp:Transcript_21721/g.51752  ORF Transcript_21721/g.51752 Transcript_21721/m.51752 type:complete len:590 (+) Transcript_21721:76-1845(+)|eukprot:CAMPEP_0197193824 /NCGR_PEP_ID=MMETSP1423-20130617/28043_1 /TAXON_ID=476441 /ORGANISM="Pseudo-nitzschia heimii, Strain UNC1101" /LENGTH=589 /DNA_ID=CAMNT_0042647123 /DNA_START=70 /DNA_END=1839 /DNA_ORIENTATION=+